MPDNTSRVEMVKLNKQFLSKYFNEDKSLEEIEDTISNALKMYLNK